MPNFDGTSNREVGNGVKQSNMATTGDIDPIFGIFKKDEEMVTRLRDACANISKGHSEMNVRLLQIEETNARARENFCSATCTISDYREQGWPVLYSVGSLFSDGLETLDRYLNGRKYSLPKDESSREALGKLLKFISYSLKSIDRPKKTGQDECEWTVTLSQHLFSKLSVGNVFTLTNRYSKEIAKSEGGQLLCPCGQGDLLDGNFGDTSFGCPDAWHGYVDIFLENITVSMASENVENTSEGSHRRERLSSNTSDNDNESSVEVKLEETFSDKKLSRLLAQCIVYSFLQQKQNGNVMEQYLVPSLGFNTTKFIVHFYDSINDILFQSAELDLFYVDNILNLKNVVFLWLTLNYRCFCSGITDDMKVYKAYFLDHAGNYLTKYQQEVRRPLGSVSQTDNNAGTHWAKESGRVRRKTVQLEFMAVEDENI